MTIIDMINRFEALDDNLQTVEKFNEIFKSSLLQKSSEKVSIGDLTFGEKRILTIGNEVITHDLKFKPVHNSCNGKYRTYVASDFKTGKELSRAKSIKDLAKALNVKKHIINDRLNRKVSDEKTRVKDFKIKIIYNKG